MPAASRRTRRSSLLASVPTFAVAVGLVGISAGMFLFTIARVNTPYIQLVLVVMVMAAGMAMCIPTMTGSIMSAVPVARRVSGRR